MVSMIGEAIKGISLEVAAQPNTWQKLRVAISLGAVVLKEILSMGFNIPYGIRAFRLYASLPGTPLLQLCEAAEEQGPSTARPAPGRHLSIDRAAAVPALGAPPSARGRVVPLLSWPLGRHLAAPAAVVVKDVRYGPRERNVLDIYIPAGRPGGGGGPLLPVALFVHGGVWASGDKWQYAPLGARCAQAGVVAVLIQYTLFPEVLAAEQVQEASRALTWTMDSIEQYGGDPRRVSIMGHSSGGHICAMLLWERARRRRARSAGAGAAGGGTAQEAPGGAADDCRQPRCFVGLSGVYDIAEHYKHEARRGVAALSCMRPANGGPDHFAAMSPALLFASLAAQEGPPAGTNGGGGPAAGGEPARWRAGSEQHQADARVAAREGGSDACPSDQADGRDLPDGGDLVCPAVLMCSPGDIVVPPTTSRSLAGALTALGCRARVVNYEGLGHGDFVCWSAEDRPAVRGFVSDVLGLLAGRLDFRGPFSGHG